MVSAAAQREIDRLFAAFDPKDPPLAERRSNWERDSLLEELPQGAHHSEVVAGGVASEWMEMPGADSRRVLLLLHGGGYNAGSPVIYRKFAAYLSRATGLRVLTPDYRLSPEHVFPAAVEDAEAAYDWLLAQGRSADDIVVGGDSAGGGLTLSLLLALRTAGKPMPKAAVVMAPWTDLTLSSPSYESLRHLDPIITRENLLEAARWYAGPGDPANPMMSPLFADLRGLPPLLIHAGGNEVMVDDSRLFAERARAASVEVTEKIWPGLWHVFHTACPAVPEAVEAIDEIGAFVRAQYAA
jgi:monoterpene epsilon-lactone hydrolase